MGFEHLRVYQVAKLLRAEVDALFAELTVKQREKFENIITHIDEAVDSVSNNISEGNDSRYPNKRKYYFDVSAGSAGEARNGISSLSGRGAYSPKRVYKAIGYTHVIQKMLRRMTGD